MERDEDPVERVIATEPAPAPAALQTILDGMAGGGRWGDRRVVKRSGDIVLLEMKDVDFVVAYDREDEERVYWYYPTKARTASEARALAETEFVRRCST